MVKTTGYMLVTIFSCAFLYLHAKGISYYSDDLWFLKESYDINIVDFLISRYQGWSSRTPIELALISIIKHRFLWELCNAFFFAIAVSAISYIISENKKELFLTSIIFLTLIISSLKKGFFKEGILWITGSLNYLWPFALAVAGYALIKGCKGIYNKKMIYSLVFFLFTLSSFNEQIVVTNIILLVAIIVLFKNERRGVSICALIATTLVFLYIIFCPGNASRFHLEIGRWNPDFVNMTFYGKIASGLNLSFDQFFSIQPIAIAIIYCSLIVLSPDSRVKITSSFLLLLTISLILFQRHMFNEMNFDTIFKFNSDSISSFFSIARIITVLFFSGATILLFWFLRRKFKIALVMMVVYVSSYASTVMLGLSPTLYSSGQRIFFVSAMIICSLATASIIHTIRHYRAK
ncbi:DUF6056 family protein [Erwinia sp. BNK-24-b]|uniref:DUF6056 family protein n=1 Tax=unclassified Erwinia TaxID=2622719 RepID=UPI0039BFE406